MQEKSQRSISEPLRIGMRIACSGLASKYLGHRSRMQERLAITSTRILVQRRGLLCGIAFHQCFVLAVGRRERSDESEGEQQPE